MPSPVLRRLEGESVELIRQVAMADLVPNACAYFVKVLGGVAAQGGLHAANDVDELGCNTEAKEQGGNLGVDLGEDVELIAPVFDLFVGKPIPDALIAADGKADARQQRLTFLR